jgi:DNA-binding NarL/FixJ family response regulator
MITVAIVEDDVIVRNSLRKLTSSSQGFRCLAACSSGEEAIRQIIPLKPQVVVMDINLPLMSGIECTRKIKAALPETFVLMLTVYDDSDSIFRALRAGASGYLLKRSEPADVLGAIRDVLDGGSPMTSQIARKVVHSFRDPTPEGGDPDIKLTEREEEILSLLAKGYANKEIADKTGTSLPTVRTHLRHVYEKLHVRSRTEAVVKFLK